MTGVAQAVRRVEFFPPRRGVTLEGPETGDVREGHSGGGRYRFAFAAQQRGGFPIEEQARVSGSIVWATGRVGHEASMTDVIAGRHVHVGRGAVIGPGALLGDKSVVTDYSRM